MELSEKLHVKINKCSVQYNYTLNILRNEQLDTGFDVITSIKSMKR